jgi:septum formation protein
MKNILENYKLLLASNSPRRKELLTQAGFTFKTISKKGIEETYPPDLEAVEVPIYLSIQKAKAYLHEVQQDEILITADTIVVCNGVILNKPSNREEAESMLLKLSGNEHLVITGVTLSHQNYTKSFCSTTKVFFNELTLEEINHYIHKFKPYDKAGAYGIQEWIGLISIPRVEGSYHNVVGLPIQDLYQELKSFVKKLKQK